MIKFSAWERRYEKKINDIREKVGVAILRLLLDLSADNQNLLDYK